MNYRLMMSLLASLLFSSFIACSGGGSKGTAPNPNNTETTMSNTVTVDSLNVESGGERTIQANRIVSRGPVNISGKLTIEVPEGSSEEVVWIVAEEGDLVVDGGEITISGATHVAPASPEQQASLLQRVFDSLVSPAFAQIASSPVQPLFRGLGVGLEAVRGNLILRGIRLVGIDGREGKSLEIKDFLNSVVSSADGGDGGDVILRANGEIHFGRSSTGFNPNNVLAPGNGGNGGHIFVDLNAFQGRAPSDTVRFSAGNGGDGGRIRLETPQVRFLDSDLPTLDCLGGQGGRGGSAVAPLTRNHEEVEGVQKFEVMGGRGGEGGCRGGQGGHVHFFAPFIFGPVDSTTPAIEARGGDGGDVLPFTSVPLFPLRPSHAGRSVQLDSVRGGDGGYPFVRGFRGRDGIDNDPELVRRHGSPGGSITAIGGNGGHVLGNWDFFAEAKGGDGAFPNQTQMGSEMSLTGRLFAEELPGKSFDVRLENAANIRTGPGGRGGSACNLQGAGGGNGGNAGAFTFITGNGGDAPGKYAGSSGSLSIEMQQSAPGQGGNGIPPGAAGVGAPSVVGSGSAGKGFNPQGQGVPGESGLVGVVSPKRLEIGTAEGGSVCPDAGGGGDSFTTARSSRCGDGQFYRLTVTRLAAYDGTQPDPCNGSQGGVVSEVTVREWDCATGIRRRTVTTRDNREGREPSTEVSSTWTMTDDGDGQFCRFQQTINGRVVDDAPVEPMRCSPGSRPALNEYCPARFSDPLPLCRGTLTTTRELTTEAGAMLCPPEEPS